MPNSSESVQRYEAQIEDYYSYKQEFTTKDAGQSVHFKLPIFADRELIAIFAAELQFDNESISTEFEDNEDLVQQLKQILKTIQSETSNVLSQSVHV